jgi:RNA polymerase sigma-70 factor (ECF subfamily)
MQFEEIYWQHKHLVYNLALQYVQNIEDAQEISQDVFVAIHQMMYSFRGESSMTTWIYRITINKSLDFLKARKRKKRFAYIISIFHRDSNETNYDIPNFNHPGVLLEDKEDLQRLFRLINELSENQRTVLILSKIEQMSQIEVAEIMSISPKAVESLLQRAKTNLQKKLSTE